jgi:hypothetical protein
LVRIVGRLNLFFIGLVCLVSGINGPRLAFGQTENSKDGQVEARSNPFLTQKEEKNLVEMGNAIPLDYLRVSAIFYSDFSSRSRAIIDGKVLVLGDSIDNKEIIKINPEDVVLEDSQGHYVAKMAGVMAETAKLE